MGGDIGVASVEHEGSLFWVELPLRLATAAAAAPAHRSVITGYTGVRKRVLVVDDAPDSRAFLTDLLKSLTFDTAEAADGDEALAKVRSLRPDLMLIDNGMPSRSGTEVTRSLRASPAFAHLPIIAVSASATPTDEQRCLSAGANAFLTKPVDVPALLDTIGRLLELHWTVREGSPPG